MSYFFVIFFWINYFYKNEKQENEQMGGYGATKWTDVWLRTWNYHLNPADRDVFKTSSGRLKKVKSYDQTRRRNDVLQKTSDLRRLEDVWFMTSWKMPD